MSLSQRFGLFLASSLCAAFFIAPITAFAAVDIDSSRYIARPSAAVDPDMQTGAFTQSYAFTLPPGRRGVQPALGLSYSSAQSFEGSIVGYGWNLSIPSLRREAKYGTDDLYSRHDFVSSLSGVLVDTALTDGMHGVYGAEVDDGARLSYTYAADESWEVTDKAGTIYTFGGDASARVADPADADHVFEWMLTSIEDTLGNIVTYSYTTDGNQVYPDRITYTNTGTSSGIFEVAFSLETRDDVFISHAAGFAVTTSYRLRDVIVAVDGQEVRSYVLSYTAGDNGVRSLLESITETATTDDGTSSLTKPVTTFLYAQAARSWSSTSVSMPVTIAGGLGSLGVYIFDVNGDAIPDIVKSIDTVHSVWLGNGDGTWTLSSTIIPPVDFASSGGYDMGVRILDVDGDSALDIVRSRSDSYGVVSEDVYMNNGDGTGWTEDASWTVPVAFASTSLTNLGVEIIDVDGDGLPDILKSRDGLAQEVYINNGSGWDLDAGYTIPVYFVGSTGLDFGVRMFDVNGDHLVDIARARSPYNEVYVNNGDGTGWTLDTSWSVPVDFVTSSGRDMGVRTLDVNTDGLVDLVYHRTDGTYDYQNIYINTGFSFGEDPSATTPYALMSTSGTELGVRFDDFDGDGVVDVLRSRNVSVDYNDLYLGDGGAADVMVGVTTSQGAETSVTYASSVEGDNPNLPFVLQVTQEVSTDDGLGNVSTKSFAYNDAWFFVDSAFNKRFAGFGEVIATDADGTTTSYFSQGNAINATQGEADDGEEFIGKKYREERADDTGHVYKTVIDAWESTSLGTGRSFVGKVQHLELLYGSGSTHVDQAVTFDYDAYGNLIEQHELGAVTGTDAGAVTDTGIDDRTLVWEYATFSSTSLPSSYKKLERLTDHSGAQIRFTRWLYDGLAFGSVSDGLVTTERHGTSTTTSYDTTYAYDSVGLLATVTDPASYVTTYSPDAYLLYPETVTNALTQDTTATYDYSSGQQSAMVDANGVARTVTYDAFDRLVEVIVDGNTVTTYAYDDSDVPSVVHQTDWFDGSISRETYAYYDGFGRQIQVRTETETSGMYAAVDTLYDELGRVAYVSLPYESSGSAYTSPTSNTDLLTLTQYDALDRPVSVTNVTGTATTSYSGRQQTEVDVNGNSVLRTFDAWGRLVSVREQEGTATFTTSYGYNAADQLVVMNDPSGNVRNFTYDQRGARLTATDLRASADTAYGTWTYTYNSRGLMASAVSPDALTTNYTYDALGRKTAEDVTVSTGTDIAYVYDSCTYGVGRLCAATVQGGSTTEYDYDAFGNVSAEDRLILGTHYVTSYTHDFQGGVTTVTYPDASVATNVLDANGSLDEVDFVDGRTSASTTAVSGITYGPHGKPTEVTYGNGVVTNYTYDDTELYRLSDLVTTSGSTALQNFSYNYDDLGNITSLTDASDLYADMSIAYTYNSRNLLTDAVATSSDTALAYTKNWSYTNLGTLHSSTDCGTYMYSGSAAGNYANPHAVTSACTKNYAYNKSGNVINDGTYSYHNNPLGLVGQVKSGTTTIVSFSYDESGNRVGKVSTASGTTVTPNGYYTVDGSSYERNILAGSIGNVATSTYTGSTASLIYHHKDHLGGTHVESDASGSSVEYILYTPFGATLTDQKTGSYENDHKYTDKEKDEDTGLYYYGARYYNSAAGVFTAQDPVYLALGTESLGILNDPQMLNSYSYSRNNPINMYDPDGCLPQWFEKGLNYVNNVTQAAMNIITGFTPFVSDYRDFVEVTTGYDMITGEQLTDDQRSFTGALTLVPIISGSVGRNADEFLDGALSGSNKLTRNQQIANSIANGHAYQKHVIERGEFGAITNSEFADRILSIMNNPSETRALRDGRTGYWDNATNTVVIHDPSSADQGSAFVPENGISYFRDELK